MKNCSTNAKEKPNVKQVTVTACDIANVVAKLLNKSKSESQEPDPQAKLARQVPIEGESPDGLGSFGWFWVVLGGLPDGRMGGCSGRRLLLMCF